MNPASDIIYYACVHLMKLYLYLLSLNTLYLLFLKSYVDVQISLFYLTLYVSYQSRIPGRQ